MHTEGANWTVTARDYNKTRDIHLRSTTTEIMHVPCPMADGTGSATRGYVRSRCFIGEDSTGRFVHHPRVSTKSYPSFGANPRASILPAAFMPQLTASKDSQHMLTRASQRVRGSALRPLNHLSPWNLSETPRKVDFPPIVRNFCPRSRGAGLAQEVVCTTPVRRRSPAQISPRSAVFPVEKYE